MRKPIGAAGLLLIKNFEGCRLTAYKPVATEKYWTIGWGHYGPDVKEGQTITQAEADAMLVSDCQRFADAVDDPANCPLTAQLNANQRDALVSFTFNCGAGCLRTLCRGRTLPQICEATVIVACNLENVKCCFRFRQSVVHLPYRTAWRGNISTKRMMTNCGQPLYRKAF